MRIAKRDRGFTLIEVLVAFTIAATSIGLLLQIHARAAATTMTAEEYLHATQLARSLVDEYSTTSQPLVFRREGMDQAKYRWTISGSELAEDGMKTDGAAAYDLRKIRAVVKWMSRTGEQTFELHTVKPYVGRLDE